MSLMTDEKGETMATEFTNGVIYWLLEMERHAAFDRTGDEDDAAEWEHVGDDIEFTLHDDENSRELIANLDKFYRVMHDELDHLARLTGGRDACDLDAKIAISLAGTGDGIESAYLGAPDEHYESARHSSRLVRTVLDLAFPRHVELATEPTGVAYVE